ncbi:MAG: DUF5721 family protein [Lachnospiraceae bacterium]|nr:DUF5721 family protein [Lachnospiraceae bacterium]
MIAYYIHETRAFMAALLTGTAFDRFLFREGQVTTFCTYTIDGTFHAAYMDASDENESADGDKSSSAHPADGSFTPWPLLRPHIFDMIKGKRTPLSFKMVFQITPEDMQKLMTGHGLEARIPDLHALFLNIRYDGRRVMITTGSAQRQFPADKAIDQMWDQSVVRFFKEKGITLEEN